MNMSMKKYDCLVDDIHCALKDANRCAKRAAKYKEDDKALAGVYYDMGRQELRHAGMLREQVHHVAAGHDILPLMWERDHERIVEWMAEINSALELFKA